MNEVYVLKADECLPVQDQRWFVDARKPGRIDIVSMITQELVATTETIEDAEYICVLHHRSLGPKHG